MNYIIFLTFLAHVQVHPVITEPTEEVKKIRQEIRDFNEDIKKKIRDLNWDTVKPILQQHKEPLLEKSNDYLHKITEEFPNLESFRAYIEKLPQNVDAWLKDVIEGLSESENSVNQFIQANLALLVVPWNAESFSARGADPVAQRAMDRLVRQAADDAHERAVALLKALRETELTDEEKAAVIDK